MYKLVDRYKRGVILKNCAKCNMVRDLSEFNINKSRPDGLTTCCRSCIKTRRGNKQYTIPETRESIFSLWVSKLETLRKKFSSIKVGDICKMGIVIFASRSMIILQSKELHKKFTLTFNDFVLMQDKRNISRKATETDLVNFKRGK